jgi:hypothetical protein
MMAQLLRRGFAPIATVLSFIAEERSAGIDQATTEIMLSTNSDKILKKRQPHEPCNDFYHSSLNSAETDQVFDLSSDETLARNRLGRKSRVRVQYQPGIDLFVSRTLSQVRDSGIGVMLTLAYAPIRLPLR